jgi:2-succinyl-5-enolpyruvyl-6-hydroxy-3-cyclohexene-1-carboxylate synthase
MNITWSRALIESLHDTGVRDVVVCAGARNSPLVLVLGSTQGFQVHSFFEERSAGFFALGVARRTGRPVAVLTTSGTATAQLLPAMIEAFHSNVPLIAMTADRPKRLRGSGAPQSIDQVGLYGKFVEREFDLENGELASLAGWTKKKPIHLNICFDEPLIDETVSTLDLTEGSSLATLSAKAAVPHTLTSTTTAQSHHQEVHQEALKEFLNAAKKLLVIVGTIESEKERTAVAVFLTKLRAPIYAEATSGLRESRLLSDWLLTAGDRGLSHAISGNNQTFTHVLRLGGVPTVRIWRDLDQTESGISVFSLSTLPFSGLSRGRFICADVSEVLNGMNPTTCENPTMIDRDREVGRKLLALFQSEPTAEPSLIRKISEKIPPRALVYVGNSLPIREWDLAATGKINRRVKANRGVNGIDGQISTFFGVADVARENWAILGDLTALYDLTAPWALQSRRDFAFRLVIINNGGGKIFERIFGHSLFENEHHLDFKNWAKMWNLSYTKWTGGHWPFRINSRHVIEVQPSAAATKRFWDQYDSFWK